MIRRSLRPFALVAACSILCAAAFSAAQDPPATPEDEALLQQAEQMIARGRFDEAVRIYQKLAERFPDSEAGAIGARRS